MNETVLVVENDADERRRLSLTLGDAGFDVMICPGPSAPDYTCLGGRGKDCPLIQPAAAIVLDLRTEGDVMMRGTPGWQLLDYYTDRGRPVVAIAGEGASVPHDDARVTVLPRHADERLIVAAVRAAMLRGAEAGDRSGRDAARP
ncbi:MAG TPA: hypothetical protein VGB83_07890 [Actinomycetota bacterium]